MVGARKCWQKLEKKKQEFRWKRGEWCVDRRGPSPCAVLEKRGLFGFAEKGFKKA
jgi:hypothetical protein